MADMLNCDSVVSKFELQSCYYVHFRTNTFKKYMTHIISLERDNVPLLSFYNVSFDIK